MDYPEDWTKKVAFMRATGATSASWSGETLLSVDLGVGPPTIDTTQHRDPPTARERQEADRKARRTVALRAVGSLMRRDDD